MPSEEDPAAAEAKALRDALPRRRAAAPEMQPPTPQSIGSVKSSVGSRSRAGHFFGSATPSTPSSTGGGREMWGGSGRRAPGTAGASGGTRAATSAFFSRDFGLLAGRPPRPSTYPSPSAASPWSRLMASRDGGRAASGTPGTSAGTASPQERRGEGDYRV